MIDLKFEINGRKVSPDKFADAFEKAAFEAVKANIRKKLRTIKSPSTGVRPKVLIKGKNLKSLSFEVSGPEEVIAEVKKALR